MSREARIFAEGALRWVQASGTGAWKTASGDTTALVGFVQVGTNFDSAQQVVTIMERGQPHHHKVIANDAPEFEFTYLQAVTANIPSAATASGVSNPQLHFELKSTDSELGGGTAQYYQFMNCVLVSRGWTEGEEGNELRDRWRALTYEGPTASGYIA